MAKQRLNASRQLDNFGERRRSNVETEYLHSIPTARQRKFWRGLCAAMRENGIEPPRDPQDRITMGEEIDKAIDLLAEKGVEIQANRAKVAHTVYMADPTDQASVTRVRTSVEGGSRQRPKKTYNWNGLGGLTR